MAPDGVAVSLYTPLGELPSGFTAGATPAAGALYGPVREQPQSTPDSAARCALSAAGRSEALSGRGAVPVSSAHAAATSVTTGSAAPWSARASRRWVRMVWLGNCSS